MLPSVFFLLLRRSKASALMPPGKQVEREGYFTVRHQIPSGSVQNIAVDVRDAHSLPAQSRRLPRKAAPSPRHDRMEADEQQQSLRHQRSHLHHGLQRDVGAMLGLRGV